MVNEEKIILSPELAQFLLEGVKFFHQNPQTPDWNNLKQETFLVLAQRLSQLTPEEEESLTDYLGRLEQYLNQVVNQELIAPSLPPNLKELVTAFEEFQKHQDADIKPPPEVKVPTIEEWIENLQQAIAPSEISSLQEKTQNVLKQTVAVSKETLEQITPPITKAVIVNAPQLTAEETNQLSSLEKNKIIENIYNAALPEITAALVENNISLSGKQTANLINQLALQTQAHIFALSAVPSENRFPQPDKPYKAKKTIATLFNHQEQQISQALEKDPTLPYKIAPHDKAPLGEQIRSVLIVNGINKQTAPLVQSLKQETRGLVFTVRGISSDVLYQALKQGEIDNRPSKEISQITFLLNYQKDFEEKHPHLAQVFKRFHRNQEALTGIKNDQILPAPPYWLVKSTNQQLDQSPYWRFLRPINVVFEKTVRDWWQKTGWGKRLASRAQIRVYRFFQNTLSSFRGLGKSVVGKTVKKGAVKAITLLSAKLAGTKLGAALGSIVPVIGNAAGAIIGLAVDIGANFFKKGIGLFNSFLASVTGGPTEAEQKLKATLGPFSFLASPLVLILIIAICVPLLLTLQNSLTTRGSFITPGAGEGEAIPSQSKYLKINKTANPSTSITAGAKVTYTITVNAPEGGLTDVVIKDSFDNSHMTIDISSINPSPSEQSENELIWSGFDFSGAGSTLTITYQATAKAGVIEDTKIRNTATVTTVHEGETITLSDSVTLNSSCQDIVNTAKEIIDTLESNNGACYYSKTSDLYSHTTSSHWCSKSPHSDTCCIYCNNLVLLAYTENGRYYSDKSFVEIKEEWRNQGILTENKENINLNQISEGDIVLFDVGTSSLAHIGIVCGVQGDGISVCEANTVTNKPIFYPLNAGGGSLGSQYNVTVNSIGQTCEN